MGIFKVARSGGAVYVRVCGLATMVNSVTFKEFADKMQAEGYGKFIVDLTECRGMDSTFMGILLGLGAHGEKPSPGDGVLVVNPSGHCKHQMAAIGLDRLVKFRDGPPALPAALELQELPECHASPLERTRLIMKAHEALVKIDKKNEERFGPFLRELAKNFGEKV